MPDVFRPHAGCHRVIPFLRDQIMKAIKFSAIGKAEIVDISQPPPAAKQVRVRVKSAGICHSDIMAFNGQHPYRVPPVITGHEASGVIEALGEGVTDFNVGDRVAIEPHYGCGQCEFCRQGHYQVCPDKKLIVGKFKISDKQIAKDIIAHYNHRINRGSV